MLGLLVGHSGAASAEPQLSRWLALLLMAARFSPDQTPAQILAALPDAALMLVAGDLAAAYCWDEEQRGLLLRSTAPVGPSSPFIRPGQSIVAQAVTRRATVIADEYEQEAAAPLTAGAGLRAALAVPLLHQERLFGALVVLRAAPGEQFSADDAEALGLLAGSAAAALAIHGPERGEPVAGLTARS